MTLISFDVIFAQISNNFSTLENACINGDANSCENIADIYFHGKLTRKDFSKAFTFYSKGCNLDKFSSCRRQGNLYSEGKGVLKDGVKAIELWKKACDRGDAYSCSNASLAFFRGEGIDKNLNLAFSFGVKGCALNDSESCKTTGFYYHGGFGTKVNLEKSKDYFKLSCDLNSEEGCKFYKQVKNYEKCLFQKVVGVCSIPIEITQCNSSDVIGSMNCLTINMNNEFFLFEELVIKNNSSKTIKDLSFKCFQYGKSGSRISSVLHTEYDIWSPNEVKVINIQKIKSQQAIRLACDLTDWK